VHIFERNFTQGLKTIFHKPFYRQNSIATKSKIAAGAILKIGLKGYFKIKYTKKYTKLGQKSLVEVCYLKTH